MVYVYTTKVLRILGNNKINGYVKNCILFRNLDSLKKIMKTIYMLVYVFLSVESNQTENPLPAEDFFLGLRESLPTISSGTAEEKWSILQNVIYPAAKTLFGTGKSKTKDCFEANTEVLAPIFKKKRDVLLRDKICSTKSTKQLLWPREEVNPKVCQ